MAISQGALARLYLYALILGCVLGAVYDLLRISRIFFGIHYSQRAIKRLQCVRLPLLKTREKRKKRRALGVVIFFEDLIYCVLCAVVLILLFYQWNNGKIRYPVFLVAGAGFFLYRITFGKLVMLFSEIIAFFVETLVRYFFFFLFFPVRFAFSQLRRIVQAICLGINNKRKRRHRIFFTKQEMQRNAQKACGLIPEDPFGKSHNKRGKKIV